MKHMLCFNRSIDRCFYFDLLNVLISVVISDFVGDF